MPEYNESGLGVPIDGLTLAVRHLVDVMVRTDDSERLLRMGELAGTIASTALKLQALDTHAAAGETIAPGQLAIDFAAVPLPAQANASEVAGSTGPKEQPSAEALVLTPEEIELEKRVYVTDRQRALLNHARNKALQGGDGRGVFQMPELLEVLRVVSPDITYDAGLQCVLRFGYRVAKDSRYAFYGRGSKVDRSYVFEILKAAAVQPDFDLGLPGMDTPIAQHETADESGSGIVPEGGLASSSAPAGPVSQDQIINEEGPGRVGHDNTASAAASATEETSLVLGSEKSVTYSRRELEFLDWWDTQAGVRLTPHELYGQIPAATPGARIQFLSVLSRKLARDPERRDRFHHTGHRTPQSKYWMDPRPEVLDDQREAKQSETQEPNEKADGAKVRVAAKVTALVVEAAPRVQAHVPGPRTDMRPARPAVESGPLAVTTVDLPSGIKVTSTEGFRRLYYRDRWIRTHSEPLEVLEMIAAHEGPMQIHELEDEILKRPPNPLISPDNLWWHLYALRRVFAELGTFAFRAHYVQHEGRTVGVVELDRTTWPDEELLDQTA